MVVKCFHMTAAFGDVPGLPVGVGVPGIAEGGRESRNVHPNPRRLGAVGEDVGTIEKAAARTTRIGRLCEAGLVPTTAARGLSHRAGRGRVCAVGQPGYRLAFLAAEWHCQCPGRMDLGGTP